MIAEYCPDPSAILEFDRLMFDMHALCYRTRLISHVLVHGRSGASTSCNGSHRFHRAVEAFLDSQFDCDAWRCSSLCRDAEAMRIAVVIGKEKLGPPVVSMFEV